MTIENTQTNKPEETQAPGPEISISDLSAIKSIIDVASERGAFKAAELEVVGKVYNKITAFLAAIAKKE